MNSIFDGFYKFSVWVMRFAYLNALWVLFLIISLVVFGFFPATVAMYTILRKWARGNESFTIFKTFLSTFKKEFLKSNLLGLVLVIIGLILYIDIQFLLSYQGGLWLIVKSLIIMISFIYILMLFYVIPIYVHFELKILQIIKNAFIYMILNPKATIMMLLGTITLYFALEHFLGIVMIFGGSLTGYCFIWYALKAFENIKKKALF